MPAFKIKDLMIHVLDPKARQGCTFITNACTLGTQCDIGSCNLPSCAPDSGCAPFASVICPFACSLSPTCGPCSGIPHVWWSCSVSPTCGPTCHLPSCAFASGCGPLNTACGPCSASICPNACSLSPTCHLPSCAFGSGCGPLNTACGPCSASFQTPFAGGGDPAAGLAALKEQLKKALADTETQEAAMNESLLPQTVEEAEDLEKRLQGVLDELKARKAELKKRASEKKK